MSRRDTDACVGNRDNDKIIAFTFDTHHHASIRRGKFDSDIDELIQHPGDLLYICLDRRQILIDERIQTDAPLLGLAGRGLDGQVRESLNIHIFLLDAEFAAWSDREHNQVIN